MCSYEESGATDTGNLSAAMLLRRKCADAEMATKLAVVSSVLNSLNLRDRNDVTIADSSATVSEILYQIREIQVICDFI